MAKVTDVIEPPPSDKTYEVVITQNELDFIVRTARALSIQTYSLARGSSIATLQAPYRTAAKNIVEGLEKHENNGFSVKVFKTLYN